MGGGISKMANQELVATIRNRCQHLSRKGKGRILDVFTAITGHHRKHGIRLLRQPADEEEKRAVGRRTCDEAVRDVAQSVRMNPDAKLRRATDGVQRLRAKLRGPGVDPDA